MLNKRIKIGDINAEVRYKDIKNLHLSVYPPNGRVRISAPHRMELEMVRIFALSKLGWIKKQRKILQEQRRETAREYITRETHYYLGKRRLLQIIETEAPPRSELKHDKIILHVRKAASYEKRRAILDEWYREEFKKIIPEIISKYENLLKVKASAVNIRRMKTKWGSCNTETGRILLNLELIKKPKECIEYIIAHELAHLKERRHNDNFIIIMNRTYPRWKYVKEELNTLPLGHTEWKY